MLEILTTRNVIRLWLGCLMVFSMPVMSDETKHAALATEVYALSGGEEYQRQGNTVMLQTLVDNYRAYYDDLAKNGEFANDEAKGDFLRQRSQLIRGFKARANTILFNDIGFGEQAQEVTIKHYIKAYNEQDLENLATFFKSSAGQKYLQFDTRRIADTVQEIQRTLIPQITVRLEDFMLQEKVNLTELVNGLGSS